MFKPRPNVSVKNGSVVCVTHHPVLGLHYLHPHHHQCQFHQGWPVLKAQPTHCERCHSWIETGDWTCVFLFTLEYIVKCDKDLFF